MGFHKQFLLRHLDDYWGCGTFKNFMKKTRYISSLRILRCLYTNATSYHAISKLGSVVNTVKGCDWEPFSKSNPIIVCQVWSGTQPFHAVLFTQREVEKQQVFLLCVH